VRSRHISEWDPLLAPVGEVWGMIPRQERAFDRALDLKLRIVLSRRNGFPTNNLAAIVSHWDDDTNLQNFHEILGIDISSGDAGTAKV
jgi:hypothetical protein